MAGLEPPFGSKEWRALHAHKNKKTSNPQARHQALMNLAVGKAKRTSKGGVAAQAKK